MCGGGSGPTAKSQQCQRKHKNANFQGDVQSITGNVSVLMMIGIEDQDQRIRDTSSRNPEIIRPCQKQVSVNQHKQEVCRRPQVGLGNQGRKQQGQGLKQKRQGASRQSVILRVATALYKQKRDAIYTYNGGFREQQPCVNKTGIATAQIGEKPRLEHVSLYYMAIIIKLHLFSTNHFTVNPQKSTGLSRQKHRDKI